MCEASEHPPQPLGGLLERCQAGCWRRAGTELNNDSRLLGELRLQDGQVVQCMATPRPLVYVDAAAEPQAQAAISILAMQVRAAVDQGACRTAPLLPGLACSLPALSCKFLTC